MTDEELKALLADIHSLALASDKAPIPGVEHRQCQDGAQRLLDYFREQRDQSAKKKGAKKT